MPNDAGTVEILEAIQSLANHMDERFARVDARFEQIDARFARVDGRFADIEHRFATKDDLLLFATKEDFERHFATKDDLREFKDEIISHIDCFAAQHNRYDTELLALRSASMRHEERITALEERD